LVVKVAMVVEEMVVILPIPLDKQELLIPAVAEAVVVMDPLLLLILEHPVPVAALALYVLGTETIDVY
jgi:hypothetical protein